MKTKDLITWGLILYALYKLSPTVRAAIGGDGGPVMLNQACRTQVVTSLQSPAWVEQLNAGGPTWTAEGEQ